MPAVDAPTLRQALVSGLNSQTSEMCSRKSRWVAIESEQHFVFASIGFHDLALFSAAG